MGRKVRWAVIVALAVAFIGTFTLLPGCESTSAERVAEYQSYVDTAQDASASLEVELDALAPMVAEAQAGLQAARAEGNTELTDKIIAYLDDAEPRLAELREKKQHADALLAAWEGRLSALQARGNITLGDELQLAGEGVREVSAGLPPPANTIGYLIGLGLTIFGGAAARRASQNRKVAEDLVDSVDALLDQSGPDDVRDVKNTLKAKQSSATRAFVDAIHRA